MSNTDLSKICQTLNCINHSINGFLYQFCANGLIQDFDRNKEVLIGKDNFVSQDCELS
jgi:hypothetical protein